MKELFERHPFGAVAVLLPVWILLYVTLQAIADAFVSIAGLPHGAHATEAIRFFVFEVPKVLLLLTLIVFVVGIIRSYFSPERTRKLLGGKKLFAGNVLASLLGVVSAFFSC